MIKNLLFFLAFLLTLSIIAYCKNSPTDDSGNNPSLTTEFDPTCTNGTASTEKVSVENTENCASCDTDYERSPVGDFMECKIPYVCTNGDPAPANSGTMNTAIENCTSCDVDYTPFVLSVGGFMECRIPYICANGKAVTEGGGIDIATENCKICDVDYALFPVGGFVECRIPYICTSGQAITGGGTIDTATENCKICDLGHLRSPVGDFMECLPDADNDGTLDITDVDADGDGLIEIRTLNDLATIRYDLDGNGLDDDGSNMRTLGNTGCEDLENVVPCNGYELMRNLDFADNSSYNASGMNMSWRPLNTRTFLVNSSSIVIDLNTAKNAGWIPIGDCNGVDPLEIFRIVCGNRDDQSFSAIFEGNGFTISNLYARDTGSTGVGLGLFSVTGSASKIRNIGLVEYTIFGGAGNDYVGGLVGYNGGSIIASYATGDVDGGGARDVVGGFVGHNGGSITASYATGDVGGDRVGGFVGQNGGSITASYATGNVHFDSNGGNIGGFVGSNSGSITASYATGNVVLNIFNISVSAGIFVGTGNGGRVTDSYAFGNRINFGTENNRYFTTNNVGEPTSVTDVNKFRSGDLGASWDFVWNFGGNTEPPALRYADYDMGNINYCVFFPVNIICDVTLLPGQGR